jgi:hypothetical protein
MHIASCKKLLRMMVTIIGWLMGHHTATSDETTLISNMALHQDQLLTLICKSFRPIHAYPYTVQAKPRPKCCFFVLFLQNVLITLTLTFYYSSNTHCAQRLILIAVIRRFFDYCFTFLATFDGRAKPLDAELVLC